jgi:Sulfotransferase domain
MEGQWQKTKPIDEPQRRTLKKLVWGVKWLLGKSRGGRNFGIYPDDTFLVSYPKSGNTWARFLLANLIYGHERVSFANLEGRIPDVYKNTQKELRRVPRPRILKSHEYFDPRYKKVIYIVRDPRDVVISYYHFHLKKGIIPDGYPLEQYVSRFVAGEIDAFGSWRENVASWLATRYGTANFLLLRYESMLDQTAHELAKIAAFLGIERSAEEISQAVELSSADRMRKMERTQANVWVNTKDSRKDIPFVRNATAGQWQSALSVAMIAEIESAWGDLMGRLGYSPITNGTPMAPADDLSGQDGFIPTLRADTESSNRESSLRTSKGSMRESI